MKKLLHILTAVMIAALFVFAIGLFASFTGGRQDLEEVGLGLAFDTSILMEELAEIPIISASTSIGDYEYHADYDSRDNTPYRISEQTRIIYDYYYSHGDFERVIEYPTGFLLGMTEEDLAGILADWQVLSFTPYEVHLRQNTDVEYRQYVIGVHEGYIAVFFDNGLGRIKELTGRPVTALALEEQQRLFEGIRVIGNDELMRALEDFSS